MWATRVSNLGRLLRDHTCSAVKARDFGSWPFATERTCATARPPFCPRLVKERGVAAIPLSAFYEDAPVKTVVRFCFAKTDATLDAALERLGKGL